MFKYDSGHGQWQQPTCDGSKLQNTHYVSKVTMVDMLWTPGCSLAGCSLALRATSFALTVSAEKDSFHAHTTQNGKNLLFESPASSAVCTDAATLLLLELRQRRGDKEFAI